MTIASRKLLSILTSMAVAVGLGLSAPAGAEELRIGYLAPLTGGLAQTASTCAMASCSTLSSMATSLAAWTSSSSSRTNRAKADVAVTKAKKLALQDKVQCSSAACWPRPATRLAGQHRTEDDVHSVNSGSGRPHAAPAQGVPVSGPHQLVEFATPTIRSGNGPATRATRRSSQSPLTTRSATRPSVASRRHSRIVRQDHQKIWPPLGAKDFGPFIPTIKGDTDAVFSLMVGPMPAQFIKQMRGAGFKKPIIGGGTSYDEFVLPFMGDEAIGDVSALHYSAALDTRRTSSSSKLIEPSSAKCRRTIRKTTIRPRNFWTRR